MKESSVGSSRATSTESGTSPRGFKISRRDFLIGGSALGMLGFGSLFLRRNLISTRDSEQQVKLETPEEVLTRLKEKFGVEIPIQTLPIYSTEDTGTGEIRPNVVPTNEESQVLFETLAKIPGAGYLAQLVIPFRNYQEGAVAGGGYLGYQWPVFFHRDRYGEFPYDRLVDVRSAIELQLPNVDLSSPLPQKTENSSLLPVFSQISNQQAGVKIDLKEEVPWTNHGERLKQAVVHEFGHGLEDQVSLAASSSVKDYWDRQTFTLFNKNTWDINHPLFVSFAKLTGWKLVPFIDFVRQYDPEHARKYLEPRPDVGGQPIWDRDFDVWGDLGHRRNRLTIYASYGPIQEAFTEFWMASILYPELLTGDEKRYFAKIHEGLKSDPQKLIQRIVSEPNLLLS